MNFIIHFCSTVHSKNSVILCAKESFDRSTLAMHQPELYSKLESNITINERAFEKYWHYIRWQRKPESIIDVGIGDGKVTKNVIMPRLPNNITEYIGSDMSEEMLDFSKTIIDHSKYNSLLMDICAKEIPLEYQNRFDKVFASFLLHILGSKLSHGVHNLYKLLKPGGQLIFTTFDRLPMDGSFEKLDKTKWRKYNNSKHISAFWKSQNPLEEYRQLAKKVGFEEVILTLQDECLRYSDIQSAKDVWESVNLVLNDVSDEDYHEYREDYFNLMFSSENYSIDERTSEPTLKCKLIFGILSKPLDKAS